MASGGGDDGEGPTTAAQTMYFCHQCNHTVSIFSSSNLVCPECNGGFLEIVDGNNNSNNTNILPHPSLYNPFFNSPRHLSPPLAPFLLSSPSPSFDPLDLSSPHGRPPLQDSEVFNPFQFLQTYLHNMGGPSLQFVIENAADRPGIAPGPGPRSLRLSLPANIGDYFIGPGLEQLIQQLAENDPNRHGTPPASKVAVENLANVTITKEHSDSDSSQCAVCMDDFELGSQVKQMPCHHLYHSECLLPWLELHNSCPVCRYQLPTDDPDYENQRNQTTNHRNSVGNSIQIINGNNNNNNNNTMDSDRTVERRFRISLPWSPRPHDSQGPHINDTSASVDAPTDSDLNRNIRSETRQEDLD